MKDNNKNLSNEAAESVAGGFRWPWQPKPSWSKDQKVQFTIFYMNNTPFAPNRREEIEEVFKNYTPSEYVSGENPTLFSSKQITQLKKLLKI